MTETALDRAMMARALVEGAKGHTSPNPHVGAVIARGDRVVSVGHHERAGEAHGEVDAIRNAAGDTEGATIYCTLEPCNHHGRTGPCTEAILEAKLARVVIGCADPHPPEPGAVAKLRAAGLEVLTGVLEDEARALVADWTRFATTGLPWVVLKAAVTLDGRIATRTGESRWITSEASREHAHRLRDRADAILVGVGTALADDPTLTVRHVEGRDPIRVVLDSSLQTPSDSKLIAPPGSEAPTWLIHGPRVAEDKRQALTNAGAELIEVPASEDGLEIEAALRELARRDVVRVLVEGGSKVHGVLLREGLAQEAAVFVAPKILGDAHALPLADAGPRERMGDAWRLVTPRVTVLGCDVLFEGALAGPPSAAGL